METYNLFKYRIARTNCEDKSIYKNDTLVKSLDLFFSDEGLSNRLEDSNGEVLSSFGVKNFSVLTLPGMDKFLEWHKEKALSVSEFFGHRNATDIEFVNSWVNKVFENASGDVHFHENISHVVSTFYPVVPTDNSADLVVVNEGLDHSKLEIYSSDNISYQNVKEGDCLFMDVITPHGITRHSNKDPRITFVFEFKYIG